MCPLLEFEADRRAFLITINSFGTELTKDARAKLYPSCGKLHPEGLTMLSNCDDFEQVRQVADMYAQYRQLFDGVGQGAADSTLEDKFFEYEVLTVVSDKCKYSRVCLAGQRLVGQILKIIFVYNVK